MEPEKRAKAIRILFTVGGAVALVGLMMLGLWLSDDGRGERRLEKLRQVSTNYQAPSVDPAKVWITRSESELQRLRKRNEELERRLKRLESQLEGGGPRSSAPTASPSDEAALPNTPASALMQAIERFRERAEKDAIDASGLLQAKTSDEGEKTQASPAEKRLRQLPPPPAPPPPATPPLARPLGAPPSGPRGQESGILVVELADPEAEEEADAPRHTTEDFLPAGSLVQATLLGGVDAPTGGLARNHPHPVVLRLEDDGVLPNRFRSHVRECHITAAVYGDLPSERAYFRTERLSCVLKDGRILERKITAYVAGEDGKTGLRGRVVEKRGAYIAKTLLAGTLGGIGKGLSQSVTNVATSALGAVQTVDPKDIGKYGVGEGFGTALEKLADWYLERADELYPVIEIDAGRAVDVVLLVGLALEPGVDAGGSKLASTGGGR